MTAEAPIGIKEIEAILPQLKKCSKLTAEARNVYDIYRETTLYYFLPQPGVLGVDEGVYTLWFITKDGYARGTSKLLAAQKGLKAELTRSNDDFYLFDQREAEALGIFLRDEHLDRHAIDQLSKRKLDLSTLPKFKDLSQLTFDKFWSLAAERIGDYQNKYNLMRDCAPKSNRAYFTRENVLDLAIYNGVNGQAYDRMRAQIHKFMTQEGLFYFNAGDAIWALRFKNKFGDYIVRMLPFLDMPKSVVEMMLATLVATTSEDGFNYHTISTFYRNLYPKSRYFSR